MSEGYNGMPYFQENFAIAFTSYLFSNSWNWDKSNPSPYWGLWQEINMPVFIDQVEEVVDLSYEVRIVSYVKYIVIGVFQGEEMDDDHCAFCQHPFELHYLNVRKSKNPDADFVYVGDAYPESSKSQIQHGVIHFETGAATVQPDYSHLLDSLSQQLLTDQDFFVLEAHTDIRGNDNETLGAARNASVFKELVSRGVKSDRIHQANFGESYSSESVSSHDRRVEIKIRKGILHKQYYEQAMDFAQAGYFASAHKIMHKEWLGKVPPDKAMLAYFDCWGSGDKVNPFKDYLLKGIKSKFYRNKELQFTLDSLNCEYSKGRLLYFDLRLMGMPGMKDPCEYSVTSIRDSKMRIRTDEIISKHGFPSRDEVGKIGNDVLMKIILTSENVDYLVNYLPKVKAACGSKLLHWRYYARLYDTVSSLRKGTQKYGTLVGRDSDGLNPVCPVEDLKRLNEYRKQVKLSPFASQQIEELEDRQKHLDMNLVSTLSDIHYKDQSLRLQTAILEEKFGFDSDQVQSHRTKIQLADSANLVYIKNLIDNRGWIGKDIIGFKGNKTLSLVIQHSDLETQLKYLPVLKVAVDKGMARGQDLALLKDRIAVAQGSPQIYGSQVQMDEKTGEFFVLPILDPKNVDKRRKNVGLGPLNAYLKKWNLQFNLKD